MAIMTINTSQKVNQAPTTVGDNTLSTSYNQTIVFTREDFTTNTTPAYSDPEGDAAENLRVLSLPSTGELQLNSVEVTINQIISFTDIDNNLFTYVPDSGTTTAYSDTFNFEISDVGSGNYTS